MAVITKNAVFWNATPCDSVRTDVSEEQFASITRVRRIIELRTTLTVTSNRSTLQISRHHIREDGILAFLPAVKFRLNRMKNVGLKSSSVLLEANKEGHRTFHSAQLVYMFLVCPLQLTRIM
jgi:hypothetical protein